MGCIIYITTNLINGKKYIGSHLISGINDTYLGSGVLLKKAIKKYGKSNFQREIIAQLDNIEDMKKLEEYYIKYYNAYTSNLFYNTTKYAAGITKCTWGDKISKSMIGHKFNLGKNHSQETKNKISKANKGKIRSEGYKLDKSNKMLGNTYALGNKLSKNTCISISQSKTGHSCYKNPERNKKIGEKNSKPILQYSLKGEFIKEYNSITQALTDLGKNPSNISACLQGRTKSAYGFIWKFKI